ncbi:hypothetical protein BST85_09985 [Aureitalea marina]|uniref:NodB homology domain-containing protein n=2 Tax=Aureitalea marina TaxID=930804 RepID=A0A2S7KRC1_9FLAO|nr:hypothetical protein BST85_09985 [Aureitalea marina]
MWPAYLWSIQDDSSVYLTFDDGPIPEVTPWVLQELQKFDAKATFFCIGNNVRKHPEILQQVIKQGHQLGNHTDSHLNGKDTRFETYLQDILKAQAELDRFGTNRSKLFRPPYGRIKKRQGRALIAQGYKIVMWDLLSGDFDPSQSPEYCWKQVKRHLSPGSIVVMHDSVKARERLEYVLPRTLEFIQKKGWSCKAID